MILLIKRTPDNRVSIKILSVFFIFLSLISISLQAEETIGQAPEEDTSHLFLRNSEVLLKPKDIQLSIGFNYNSDESQRSFRKNRSRDLSIPLGISYGVTKDLELNASIPLVYKRNEVIAPSTVSKESQSGFGDLSLGASYKLKVEQESSPSITASFGITAPTGKKADDNDVSGLAAGSGHWGVSTGLHISKSIDPAVVFANVGYQHTFKDKQNGSDIQPGDSFSYGFGAGLSINSSVSFSGRIVGSYQLETKLDNEKITGSSGESISFIAGMSYRLGRKTRLETDFTIGLSEDAGDVGIGVSYIWNL